VSHGRVDVLGTSVPVVGDAVPDGAAVALVRPEALVLAAGEAAEGVEGMVFAASFLGPISRLTVVFPDGRQVMAQLPTSQAIAFPAGSTVRVSVRPDPVPVSPVDSPS
jgi:putative spermidine/putrescine transport system ATP-binding protein